MSEGRIARQPLIFIADQALMMNPLLAPLWLGGLTWLLLSKRACTYRFLGWTFLGIFVPLLLLKAKNYYVSPAYPMLFAAGAVALEQATDGTARWVRSVYVAAIVLVRPRPCSVRAADPADQRFPLLSAGLWRLYSGSHGEEPLPLSLPQQFADEFGWEEMVHKTALAFNRLPDKEKRRTAIFANDYGEAAAVDFFGPRYGLPQAISKNESFWLWGPRNYTGKTVLVLGSDGTGDREHFKTVDIVGRVDRSLLPRGRTF